MAERPRSSKRYSTTLPIKLRTGDLELDGTTHNLSLGGTCVALGRRLALGTRVQLAFAVPGSDRPIEVDGEVRWSSADETGIQFASLRARAVWDLNEYFERLPR